MATDELTEISHSTKDVGSQKTTVEIPAICNTNALFDVMNYKVQCFQAGFDYLYDNEQLTGELIDFGCVFACFDRWPHLARKMMEKEVEFKGYRENLVVAASFLLREIERLDRLPGGSAR